MIRNTMTDRDTGKRITTLRTDRRIVRISEHVDGPASCVHVPTNPRHSCIGLHLPRPMSFDGAVTYFADRLSNNDALAS